MTDRDLRGATHQARDRVVIARKRHLITLGFSPEWINEKAKGTPTLPPRDTMDGVISALSECGVVSPNFLLQQHPSIAELTGDNIRTTAEGLLQRGFENVPRIITKAPTILNYTLETIDGKMDDLAGLGFTSPKHTASRAPQILTMASETLAAKVQALSNLGFENPVQTVESSPTILEYASETIGDKMEHLRKLGFENPVSLIQRFPALVTYSKVSVAQKIEYLDRVAALYDFPLRGVDLATQIPWIFAAKLDKLAIIVRILKELKPEPETLNTATLQRILRSNIEDLIVGYSGIDTLTDDLSALQKRIDISTRSKKSTAEKQAIIFSTLPNDNKVKQRYSKAYPKPQVVLDIAS